MKSILSTNHHGINHCWNSSKSYDTYTKFKHERKTAISCTTCNEKQQNSEQEKPCALFSWHPRIASTHSNTWKETPDECHVTAMVRCKGSCFPLEQCSHQTRPLFNGSSSYDSYPSPTKKRGPQGSESQSSWWFQLTNKEYESVDSQASQVKVEHQTNLKPPPRNWL